MKALVALTLLFGTLSAQAAEPVYTPIQEEVLTELKSKTIQLVEKQKSEAEKLRRCFALPNLCDDKIKEHLPMIRKAIKQKSEEYRMLVGLSQGPTVGTNRSASLSMNLPRVNYRGTNAHEDSAELKLIKQIYSEDMRAVQGKVALAYADKPTNPYVNLQGYAIQNEQRLASKFYEMQAFLIVHQVPFAIYVESDVIDDGEITRALGKYINRIGTALTELYDPAANPLQSFLIYAPVVNEVASESPVKKATIEELILKQKHTVGMKAWIERNSPSIKLAAFTTCSLVAAILQAWPVSLACGGTLAAMTGKQLYDDYQRMTENFALWLTGVQTEDALRNSEARVMYSTLALFFAGQGVGTTIIAIETSLVTTLSTLPGVAAARFTSLSALREGSIRFASRTVEFKGKDLGASLFAGHYSEITDKNVKLTKEERVFTYKDLLLLQEVSAHPVP